ncbi:thioredoxin [Streptococcus danieliae]|uniref:Thioredoxin n=1 Tax=Streptococcus danieliae TaxID=747656 RepID=A0A7X3G7S2_9STRE|nr:thioredoxin family protein [Streptococcus danieliae]MVX58723.1 thioredoxin [Streptococcus danieliae]
MKKIFVYIILIVSLVGNIYFIFIAQELEQLRSKQNTVDMYRKLDSLLVDNFMERYNSGERLSVYFGRSSCEDCSHFDPIFIDIIERYKLGDKVYYVNVEGLHENKFEWENFKEEVNIKGTPTIAIYENKKILTKLDFEEQDGFTSYELESWISKNLLKLE